MLKKFFLNKKKQSMKNEKLNLEDNSNWDELNHDQNVRKLFLLRCRKKKSDDVSKIIKY